MGLYSGNLPAAAGRSEKKNIRDMGLRKMQSIKQTELYVCWLFLLLLAAAVLFLIILY